MQYTISHPLRVRELKPLPFKMILNFMIAPLAGAWIETIQTKLVADTKDRTPCGCVNWNFDEKPSEAIRKSHPLRVRELKRVFGSGAYEEDIAPLAGAWIETLLVCGQGIWIHRTPCGCVNWNIFGCGVANIVLSHPLRVRELKLFQPMMLSILWNRTPCGCVNWNYGFSSETSFGKSHPLRVRELKHLKLCKERFLQIAPLAGAWIETSLAVMPHF